GGAAGAARHGGRRCASPLRRGRRGARARALRVARLSRRRPDRDPARPGPGHSAGRLLPAAGAGPMTARELRTARRGYPWRLVPLAAATALLTLLLPALAAAQEPTIEAEAALEPPQTTLGSHVRLVVTVLHPEDLLITAADPVAVEGIELVRREP